MRNFILVVGIILTAFIVTPQVRAQGASRGPDPTILRDSELERDSSHHLEVARHYFKTRKAYISALLRLDEVIAGNPTFSKFDEVLYIAGMSNLYLSEKRGKQAPKEPAEKYRQNARTLLSELIQQFPESSFRAEAEKGLLSLGPEEKPDPVEKKPL